MKLVYLAQPVDQAGENGWADDLSKAITSQPDHVVFRPPRAFELTKCRRVDPRIEEINREVLNRCDAMVAVVPRGVPSIGVPREIEHFASLGRPWAVMTDLHESFSLADALHAFPLTIEGLFDAARWVIGLPIIPVASTARAELIFAKDGEFDGQLPSRTYAGDAGYDLYVAQDVIIPSGCYKDVPSGVRVALPPNTWARIVGRSSTMRNRGLLVNEGVIDNGWRGPLFFGVKNLGEKAAHLIRGERIAQLIISPNLSPGYAPSWASAAEFETIPHDGRGTNGFGSSGA